MEEERQMTCSKVGVVLETRGALKLADVDIEDVDHDGALHHVHDGEDQRDGGDVEVQLVAFAVSDEAPVPGLVPRQGQHLLHHQEERHHHLYGGLDTPGDAVGDPGKHLQSGRLHVVDRGGGGDADVPEVHQVPDGGDEGVEKEA